MIHLEGMLQSNDLSRSQLIDLAIMIGTDFHPGIRGIGPKTGLKLIRKHGTMEEVSIEKGFDLPENLEEIRELFTNHPIHPIPLPRPLKSIEDNDNNEKLDLEDTNNTKITILINCNMLAKL